jgi:hypothetical protein
MSEFMLSLAIGAAIVGLIGIALKYWAEINDFIEDWVPAVLIVGLLIGALWAVGELARVVWRVGAAVNP